MPKFSQFQNHLILWTEIKSRQFFYSTYLQSWIEQNVGEKFQLQFLPSLLLSLIDRFLCFVFSWVIQQPCFHYVKCCFLDARGASFLTSRNVNYLASVAFKFVRFPRAFISNLIHRASKSKAQFSWAFSRSQQSSKPCKLHRKLARQLVYFFGPLST